MTTVVAEDKGGLFTISGRQWLILLMVQLANMLFGMTITIANLVLPQMRGNLSATQDEISWVITLNLVATAVATPMTGWLASRLGWRNLMFFTVLGFTITSLLCGFAGSLETLILARVAQGAFGAPIMPLGQAILLATFPKHLQPTAIVIWGIGAVFGPVLGPILGSIATEAYDWRAAFFIIVPPGLCALVCIWFALRDHTARSPVKFDWTGFIALSVAITCAQLIFDRGHRLDWFESTEMILFAFTGVVALWIFVVHCLTVPEPFVNPRLLLDRNFTIGILLALVMGMLNFTSIVLFPTLLHDLRGYPDNAIAMLIAARGMGNWAAFLFIVQLTRIAPRFAIICGMGIQAAAGFWMAQWNINLTDSDVFWGNFLLGLRPVDRLHADDGHGLLDPAAAPGDGGLGRLHPDAQLRLQPVHLHRRAGRQPLDRVELFAHDRVHHALQQDADGARPAAAVEPRRRRQPADPVERDPAAGGHDRLPQCLLPDGLRRPGGDAAGRLHARRKARVTHF